MSDFLDDDLLATDEQDLFHDGAMQRPISELPELQPLATASPDDSIRSVINLLVEKRVGCALIVSEGQLMGVFSERDVLRKVATSGVDIDATPVGELMTKSPETLRQEDELVYALHQMAVGGYRHIPLVDQSGAPTAVLSMRDIVVYLVSLCPDEVLKLPSHPDRAITQTREGA
ncbi:MAG: CBS domain-containing protein [Planctomycetota bacterium]|jgi:CBS domain-containing protein